MKVKVKRHYKNKGIPSKFGTAGRNISVEDKEK